MKINLAQKIVLAIEIVVITFAVIGGVSTYYILRKSITSRINAHLESVAVLKEQNVKRFLGEVTAEIEYAARSEDTSKDLILYLREKKQEDKLMVLGHLTDLYKEKDIFSSVFVVDVTGNVLVSTLASDEGKIKSLEPYFIKAQEKTVIENFYYDVAIAAPTLIIATPIKDLSGKLIGVIVGRINISEINSLMTERSGLGSTEETFLVSSTNVVVTDLVKEPGSALKKTIFLPQIVTCLEGSSNFTGIIDYHGDAVIGYWRWIPSIDSCMVTKIDSIEAFVSVRQAEVILLGVVVALGLILGIFGYFIGRSISAPLFVLRDRAQEIAGGDYTAQVDLPLGDEIGQVATSFNEMAKRLKESYESLEINVREKTDELNKKLMEMDTKNIQMKTSEVAMLNILEDSRELEKQLAEEKKGVEQKIIERTKQLKEERAKLMASISALPRAFIIVDINNQIVAQNGKLESIFGKVEGEWDLEKIDEKLGDTFELGKKLKQVFVEKKVFDIDEFAYGAKFLRVYMAPVFDEDNILIGAVTTIKDATEARVLSRSKDEFFSIASHELRTPLTAIRGNTSMILDYYKEALKDPELMQMIVDTHDASIRLIGIVNDFLDMSRLEMGKVEYKIEDVKLLEIVNKVVKDLDENAKTKGVQLKTTGDEKVIAKADIGKVEQILFNIIGNSLKFTDAGSVTINVLGDADLAHIEITDTGKGIPLSNQGLLFHKFQQAGSSLTTREGAKGTGLGLYISKLMAEGMGGKLELVRSEEGKGSVFGITLPTKEIKK